MDVTSFRVLFCLLFVVLGATVLWTYWVFYKYYQRLNEDGKASVWAIWGHPVSICFWGFLATLSTLAFIFFSIWIPINASDIVEQDVTMLIVSYGLFLLCSVAYALLMQDNYQAVQFDPVTFKKCVVMIDLILVSISLIVLFVWIQKHVGWSPAGNACLTTGMLILTIHCTVLDFILWGGSWCWGMRFQSGEWKFPIKSFNAGMPTPPLPWPTISRADICALTRPPPPHLRPPA